MSRPPPPPPQVASHMSTTGLPFIRKYRVEATNLPNTYRHLADAIAAIPPNTRTEITVGGGVYDRPVYISGRVDIEIRGDADSVPVFTGDSGALHVDCDPESTFVCVGLKFESESSLSPAVLVTSGVPLFSKCQLQSVHVDQSGCVQLEHSKISGSPSNGLCITGGGCADVRSCVFRGALLYHILAECSSSPVIYQCQFFESGRGAIALVGSECRAVVAKCAIEDLALSDRDTADVDASASRARSSLAASSATLTEGSDHMRAAVVAVRGAASHVTVEDNTIFGGTSCGIAVYGDDFVCPRLVTLDIALATALNLKKAAGKLSRKKRTAAGSKAVPVVMPLNVQHDIVAPHSGSSGESDWSSWTAGDHASYPTEQTTTSSGKFRRNIVRDNQQYGVYVCGAASSLSVTDTTLERNAAGGCVAEFGGTLFLHQCTLSQHRETAATAAVVSSEPGSLVRLAEVQLLENAVGMASRLGGFIVADVNTTVDSGTIGLLTQSSGCIDVKNVKVTRCSRGVVGESCGLGVLQQCVLESNGTGYDSCSAAHVRFLSTTLRRNGCAVDVHDGGRGAFDNCVITDSTGSSQIVLSSRGNPTFTNTDIKSADCPAVVCKPSSRGAFVSCLFSAHKGKEVVRVERLSDTSWRRCKWGACEANAVVFAEGAAGELIECDITGACRAGILVKHSAEPTIRGCSIRLNATGVELEAGCGALFEKNVISDNTMINVQATGRDARGVVIRDSPLTAIVSCNTIRQAEYGVRGGVGTSLLVSRNIITHCTFGVHSGEQSRVVCVGNKMHRCVVAIAVAGKETEGTFLCNTIAESRNCGMWVAEGTRPMVQDNIFMGHFPAHAQALELTKMNGAGDIPIPLRLDPKSGGFFVGNRFVYNTIGALVDPQSSSVLLGNYFAHNGYGLLHKAVMPTAAMRPAAVALSSVGSTAIKAASKSADASSVSLMHTERRSEYLVAVLHRLFEDSREDPEPSAAADDSGVLLLGNVFQLNYNGLVVSDVAALLDVDSCSFFTQHSCSLVASRQRAAVCVTHCLFHHAAAALPGRHVLLQGAPKGVEEGHTHSSAVKTCIFFGAAASVTLDAGSQGAALWANVFVGSSVVLLSGSSASIRRCSFIGIPAALRKIAASHNREGIEFVSDPDAIEWCRQHVGVLVFGNRMVIARDTFAAPVAIDVRLGAAVSLRECVVSLYQKGIVCDGTSDATVVADSYVGRCRDVGVLVTAAGFRGALSNVVVASNFGVGLSIQGPLQTPWNDVAVVNHKAVPLLESADIKSQEDTKTLIASFRQLSLQLQLEDHRQDKPFNGVEGPQVDSAAAVYGCKALPTEHQGVGVLVQTRAAVTFSQCIFAGAQVANVMVAQPAEEPAASGGVRLSECLIRDAQGYGVVVRSRAEVTISSSWIVRSGYCGVLVEPLSRACIDDSTFENNDIGLFANGDDRSVADRCVFTSHRICAARCVYGSSVLLRDCVVDDNSSGVECLEAHPTIDRCLLQHNALYAIVVSGSSHNASRESSTQSAARGARAQSAILEPTVLDCVVRKNGVGGVVIRREGMAVVKRTLLHGNNCGLTVRAASIIAMSECTVQENLSGALLEWSATGIIASTLWKGNLERSIVSRSNANVHIRHCSFLREPPIAVMLDGRGTFSYNVFRSPLSNCFVVAQGGNPVIAFTKFVMVHGTSADRLRAKLLEERDVDTLRAPLEVAEEPPLQAESVGKQHYAATSEDLSMFVMPLDGDPSRTGTVTPSAVSNAPQLSSGALTPQPSAPPSRAAARGALSSESTVHFPDRCDEMVDTDALDELAHARFTESAAFTSMAQLTKRKSTVAVHRPDVGISRRKSYSAALALGGHSDAKQQPGGGSSRSSVFAQERKHSALLDMPAVMEHGSSDDSDGDAPGLTVADAEPTSHEASGKHASDVKRLSVASLQRRRSSGSTASAHNPALNRRISSHNLDMTAGGPRVKHTARSQLALDLKTTADDVNENADNGLADAHRVVIAVESGGLGLITNCIFAHNQPCSVLCDGPAAHATVEHCLFYDHRVCSIVVTGGSSACIRGNYFTRNANAVQMFHASGKKLIVEENVFRLNLSSIEALEGDCGAARRCHFFNDDVSVLCGSGSIFRLLESRITSSDDGVIGEPNSQVVCEGLQLWGCRDALSLQSDEPVSVTPVLHADSSVTETLKDTVISCCGNGIRCGNRRDVRLQDIRVVMCAETGISLAAPPPDSSLAGVPSSVVVRNVSVSNCLTGIAVSGDNCMPEIIQCNVAHCGTAVSATDAACPSLDSCVVSNSTRGIVVQSSATGTYRAVQVYGCHAGITVASGDLEYPCFSKCYVYDCSVVGLHFQKHCGGQFVEGSVFECGVCVMCEPHSYGALAQCTISHPSNNDVTTSNDACRIAKFGAPRITDVAFLYKTSPVVSSRTARMRRSDHDAEMEEHKRVVGNTLNTWTEVSSNAKRRCDDLLGAFGMASRSMQTLPIELPKKDAASPVLAIDVRLKESVALCPAAILQLVESAGPVALSTYPLCAAALGLVQNPAKIPLPSPYTSLPLSQLEALLSGGTPVASGSVFGGAVKLLRPLTIEHMPTPPLRVSDAMNSLQRVLPFSIDTPRHPAQQLPAAGNTNMEEDRNGSAVRDSVADDCTLSDLLTAPQTSLLPAIAIDAFDRVYDAFPSHVSEARLSGAALDDLRRRAKPVVPSALTLQLLRRQQFDKCNYTHEVTQTLHEISKKHNTLFADQLLFVFSTIDRRRAELVFMEDVVAFLEDVANVCELQSPLTRALHNRRKDFRWSGTLLSELPADAAAEEQDLHEPTARKKSLKAVVRKLSKPRTSDTSRDGLAATFAQLIQAAVNKAQSVGEGSRLVSSIKVRPEDVLAVFSQHDFLSAVPPPTAGRRSSSVAPDDVPIQADAFFVRRAVLVAYVHRYFASLHKSPASDGLTLSEFAALVTANEDGQLTTYLRLYFPWMSMPQPSSQDLSAAAEDGTQRTRHRREVFV